MIEWLFNLPLPFYFDYLTNFFGKLDDGRMWLDLLLTNFSFFLLILIPGYGLSYLLQPKTLDRSLRASFALALGFLLPVILFYVLGLTNLYFRGVWAAVGVLISAFVIVLFRRDFLSEWRAEPFRKSVGVFYGLMGLYFLISYIALYALGTLDADILFGQVGPASHLFRLHGYNPFDMGVLPELRHELFPGPISFHSVFMLFWVQPWVAVTGALVILAPLMVMMISRLSETAMKGSGFLTAFLSLVTFGGFRLRGGRGTVLALIFFFAFLLLPQIFEELKSKEKLALKSLWRPIVSGSIFLSLALYTNIEIAAILLGVLALLILGSWLTGYQNFRNVLLLSISGGLLLYLPWFGTVDALIFHDQFWMILGLYGLLAVLPALFVKVPNFRLDEKLLERIALFLLLVLTVSVAARGELESVFRLHGYLMGIGGVAAALFFSYVFYSPNWKRDQVFLAAWLFGLIYIFLYPFLRPVSEAIGLPENLSYFLFDKELGSVFPELRAKVHEYFLPFFGIMPIAFTLLYLQKNWPWKKWIFGILLVPFLFVTTVRVHSSDLVDYIRGQSIGANVAMLLGTNLAYQDSPGWYTKDVQEIMMILDAAAGPDDRIFNLTAVYNPYNPMYVNPYIHYGIGMIPLSKEDLVSEDFTTELLTQVIAADADYIWIIPNSETVELWLKDPRLELLTSTDDAGNILMRVLAPTEGAVD